MLDIKRLDQRGSLNPLLIPLILSIVVFVGSFVAAVMYYSKYIEQKDVNKPIIAAAVEEAESEQKERLETEFLEREKRPTKSYTSPQHLGTVKLSFPKTWSSYVKVSNNNSMDFYAHPNYVPSDGVNYALRMSVTNRSFAQEIKSYDSRVKKQELKAGAVRTSGATGTRLDGFFERDKEGSMVIFPLRDKTLRVWTESNEFKKDYEDIVLAALSFIP